MARQIWRIENGAANSAWGAQNQAVLDSGSVPPPLSISVGVGSIPKPFGVGLVSPRKNFFFVSEISADPQKRPYGVKGVFHRVKNGQKFPVEN